MLASMSNSIIAETRRRCPELAEFLEDVCAQPLRFEGSYANAHSAENHTHLWALEWWAERHDWIDLDYRVEFVEEIFARWRGRLKGLPPYRAAGYRVYLYQDMAPTVSVVANLPEGCPYGGRLTFVPQPRDVMAAYVGRRWSLNFKGDWPIEPGRILDVIEHNQGSISKPSADMLGLPVSKLRILIEQMGLERRVNEIRKRYKRRPAKFHEEAYDNFELRIFEEIWPMGYR